MPAGLDSSAGGGGGGGGRRLFPWGGGGESGGVFWGGGMVGGRVLGGGRGGGGEELHADLTVWGGNLKIICEREREKGGREKKMGIGNNEKNESHPHYYCRGQEVRIRTCLSHPPKYQ